MPEATAGVPNITLTPPQEGIGSVRVPQPPAAAREAPFIPPRMSHPVDTTEAKTGRLTPQNQSHTLFEHRYPPDRLGEEAGDKARVWPIYRDRVTELDDDMLEGWNDTLNVLLVFAGLFSAACTAFLIEIYKTLQPDWQQATAMLVYALHNNLNPSLPPVVVPNPSDFEVQTSARWTNILWFTSLAFSLIASLLAILAKQWLNEYKTRMRSPAASPRAWALQHVSSRRALDAWGMNGFISSLPLLLHVSLFLFLVGLCVLMLTTDHAVGIVVVCLTFGATTFYVVAGVAPAVWGDCPTVTPALRQACRLWAYFPTGRSRRWRPKFNSAHDPSQDVPQREADALSWMIRTLPDDEDVRTALRAVGGLSPRFHHQYFNDRGRHSPLLDEDILDSSASALREAMVTPTRSGDTTMSCIMRAILFQGRDVSHIGTEHAGHLIRHCHTLPFDVDILCLPLKEIQRRWFDAPTVGFQSSWHVHSVGLLMWSMRDRVAAERVLLLIALLVRSYRHEEPQSDAAWHLLRALEAEAQGILGSGSRWQPPSGSDYAIRVVSVLDALMLYRLQQGVFRRLAYAQRSMRAVMSDFVRRARIGPAVLENMGKHFIFMSHNRFRTHTVTAANLDSIGQLIFLSGHSSSTAPFPENTGVHTFRPLNLGLVAIHFNLLYHFRARTLQITPTTRAWMERLFVQSTSPTALIGGLTSPTGTLCSHLELLRPRLTRTGEVTSSWKMMYELLNAETRPVLAVYAFSFSVQLYALHRGGATELARELMYQLMSHTCGISLLCRSLLWRDHLALHAKRVSPGWWNAARTALLQIDVSRWLPSPGANTPLEFVEAIDLQETCHCDNIAVERLDTALAAASSTSLASSLPPVPPAQNSGSLALPSHHSAESLSRSTMPHSRRWREALRNTMPIIRRQQRSSDVSNMLELGEALQLDSRRKVTAALAAPQVIGEPIPAMMLPLPGKTNLSTHPTIPLEENTQSSGWSTDGEWLNDSLVPSFALDFTVEHADVVFSSVSASPTLAGEAHTNQDADIQHEPRISTAKSQASEMPLQVAGHGTMSTHYSVPSIVVEDYEVMAKT